MVCNVRGLLLEQQQGVVVSCKRVVANGGCRYGLVAKGKRCKSMMVVHSSSGGVDGSLDRSSVNTNGVVTSPNTPTSTNTLKKKKLQFPRIQGSDFQHPLDKQNTNLLKSLPGLQFIAKSMIMSAGAEEVLFLENISSSILVGPNQLPSVHALVIDACETLGMTPPDVYVRQNPVPNAYTLALSGRRPFIVIHTSLLDLLDEDELQAVIAHELGHLKCDHAVWLTAANVLALGTVSLLPIFTATVEDAVMRWLRAAELSCDRAALLVTQNPTVVVRSFMKLAGGSYSKRFADELNVEAFLEQARSYEKATASPMGWYLRNAQNRALSHPLPVLRAREIDAWSHSGEYRSLLMSVSRQKDVL
jgi:Zn-dependent protease with chaperone function